MKRKSVKEWLRWQESLNPDAIDLSLERTRAVAARLPIDPPPGGVFTIAGTNGKGSCAHFLDNMMRQCGQRTAVYSSPHLVRYNERIRLDGVDVTDELLVDSFQEVETARQDIPLTYFEFGTLAALVTFSRARTDIWILEVGLGGRLDAVNVIDPDYSLITTVALDHQEWLGHTIEEIAAEKAGIMRPETPAFFGDTPVPEAIADRARNDGAVLHCLGESFTYAVDSEAWNWIGRQHALNGLRCPTVADGAQLRNVSVALAAIEAYDADMLTPAVVNKAVAQPMLPGRFQIVDRGQHQWVLDVAHNPQAARALRHRLGYLGQTGERTAVLSMLADKQAAGFIAELADKVDQWIVCAVDDPRASSSESLAAQVSSAAGRTAIEAVGPADAFETAQRLTDNVGQILVCGSFRIVGPALQWLGLY